METLGLSGTNPRTEGRLKSLFWPSIQNGSDVDYVATQGYWVCTIVAVLSFLFLVFTGKAVMGVFILLFFYLGGVGVRERSRYAAAAVLFMYSLDTLAAPSILRVIVTGLLLSNLRAAWIAAGWKPESEEAVLPQRLSETWTDKLADQFPMWLWPKVRIAYYLFTAGFLLLVIIGLVAMLQKGFGLKG